MDSLDAIIRGKKYDYIDFGCSKGGSLEYGNKVLGGTLGVGLDIAPDKVAKTRAAGFNAIEADVTQLGDYPNCTRFVTMMDFLEHLPSFDLAFKCIDAGCTAASDFVFVVQPWFDSDGYLLRHGLKLFWSDWHGHPNTMTSLEIYRVLRDIKQIKHWRIYARGPIPDSTHAAVHAITSPVDQHSYNTSKHPTKPKITFTEPVYQQIGFVALMNDAPELFEVLDRKLKWSRVLMSSNDLSLGF